MIPFGPYLPDQPDLDNPGLVRAINVLPRTQNSYGPIAALAAVGAALTNRMQGANGFRDSGGNVYPFAGDLSDLFKFNKNAATWDNVSKSAGAYLTAADDNWNFIRYGQRVIAANGYTDAIQNFLMGTDSVFSDLNASAAPKAKHLGVIGDFVFSGDISGGFPNRVHWCAVDDPTDWPTIGSADAAAKLSDRQDLAVGGAVQHITGAIGGSEGAIFLQKAIYRVQFDGPPTAFSFRLVEEDRGVYAKNTVVNIGNFGFYLSEDGFMSFDGTKSVPIGDKKVDKTFFNEVDQEYLYRVLAAADPINKIYSVAYPGSGNTAGRPNKILWYDWSIDRWSNSDIETEFFFRDLSHGYTLDQLDQFGTLDTLPASLDSRIWTGGTLLLSAQGTDKKLARFTGSSLGATFETAEANGATLFGKPKERILVNGVRPYIDVPDAKMRVYLKHRDSPGATLSSTSQSEIDADGEAHFTTSSRYQRAVISLSASSSWSHASGFDYDAQEDGEQ